MNKKRKPGRPVAQFPQDITITFRVNEWTVKVLSRACPGLSRHEAARLLMNQAIAARHAGKTGTGFRWMKDGSLRQVDAVTGLPIRKKLD